MGRQRAFNKSETIICGRCSQTVSSNGFTRHSTHCIAQIDTVINQNNKRPRIASGFDDNDPGNLYAMECNDDSFDFNNIYDGAGYGDNPGPGDDGGGGGSEDSSEGSDIGDPDKDVPDYENARFIPLNDVNKKKHSLKYLNHQNNHLKGLFGSDLQRVNSRKSFENEVSFFV